MWKKSENQKKKWKRNKEKNKRPPGTKSAQSSFRPEAQQRANPKVYAPSSFPSLMSGTHSSLFPFLRLGVLDEPGVSPSCSSPRHQTLPPPTWKPPAYIKPSHTSLISLLPLRSNRIRDDKFPRRNPKTPPPPIIDSASSGDPEPLPLLLISLFFSGTLPHVLDSPKPVADRVPHLGPKLTTTIDISSRIPLLLLQAIRDTDQALEILSSSWSPSWSRRHQEAVVASPEMTTCAPSSENSPET
jgi:hypothetical protein